MPLMNKLLLLFFFLALVAVGYFFITRSGVPQKKTPSKPPSLSIPVARNLHFITLKKRKPEMLSFARRKGLSTRYAFMIDMGLPSGRNRFFVYDLQRGTVLHAGLVAHGSCNSRFLEEPEFSNVVGQGCSSLGRYKVGYSYNGNFGKAYKLFGLDSSNSNAFERAVVLHAYSCVPDKETDPMPICNSLGCPMISYNFLETLSSFIDRSERPVMLWIF
jgi:hypothetical protein